MQVSGDLIDKYIIVKKPKDIGRLYNKSHFGNIISDNNLELDLIEGVFLLGENKIRIFYKQREISFRDLVEIAIQHISEFEIKYLIFKDLRNRGLAIKLCEDNEKIAFFQFKQKSETGEKRFYISIFSERDVFEFEVTKDLIYDVAKKNGELWFGIVDEEGDITYYDVKTFVPKGSIGNNIFSKGEGIFLRYRVVIFDKKLSKNLLKREFFGKPFGDGLQLSIVESIYLLERGVIDILTKSGKKLSLKEFKKDIEKMQPDIELRFLVFRDLKKRGLIVKTGFKFGSHFRVYTKHFDETHAEYLIQVVEKGYNCIWAEMSRAVRLAHSVNKEIIFARVDAGKIDYIKFGRLRP